MKKSLTQGDHSGKFLTKLEDKFAAGTAASKIANMLEGRVSLETFTVLKPDIQKLIDEGYTLTENVCRHWCAHMAEHHLAKNNLNEYVETLRCWLLPGEACLDEDTEIEFDISCPRLWQVAPTKADEDALDEDVEAKPDLPAELRDWEMARKFDKSVKTFGDWLLNAWSCDSLYTLLKTDLEKSEKVMSLWLSSQEKGDKTSLGPLTLGATDTINTFATAYLSVVSSTMMTVESHEPFSLVFLPGQDPRRVL